MRHRSRLFALALACACVSVAAFSATASAATLSISAKETGFDEWKVTATGETSEESDIWVVVGPQADPCPGSLDAIPPGDLSERGSVPPGPFSTTISIRNSSGSGSLGPKKVICGYVIYHRLSGQPNAPVEAAASTFVGSDPTAYVSALGENTLDPRKPAVTGFTMSCGDTYWGTGGPRDGDPCSVKASATLSVSTATRKRLKLPSKVIAKGTTSSAGHYWGLALKASPAVRKRLKRVASLTATLEVRFTSPSEFTKPIRETMKLIVTDEEGSARGTTRLKFIWDRDGNHVQQQRF